MIEEYREALAYLEEKLGTKKAVCNCLGLHQTTLTSRLSQKNQLKKEHLLALEGLINRIDR